MESNTHSILKLKAIQRLYQNKGCKYVTQELKYGKYIFDVIGTDGKNIYIVEAKQARSDYFSDYNNPIDIKKNIEEYKKLLLETGDEEYKKKIDCEREKSTKLYDKSLYKLSNERYVITTDSLIKESEFAEGWGLINEEPRQIVGCEKSDVDKSYITKIIYEIAKRNTKLYLKSIGVDFSGKDVSFPEWELYL